MANNKPIGVFDSGIGGLTVVKEIIDVMPNENLIYFGDTARTPYGSRPVSEIQTFTEEILDFLAALDVKMAIMACNTITMWCLEKARQKYDFPIIGMNTGEQAALRASKKKNIGVVATEATINSRKHYQRITASDKNASVYQQACPLFCPMVEREELDGPAVDTAVQEYMLPVKAAGVDTLILACTHFPFLLAPIRRIMGPDVTIIDPARQTAMDAYEVLKATHLLADGGQSAVRRFCFSADTARAKRLAEKIIAVPLTEFELVSLKAAAKPKFA